MSTTELPTKDDILNTGKYVKLSFKEASRQLKGREPLLVYLLIRDTVKKKYLSDHVSRGMYGIRDGPNFIIFQEGWDKKGTDDGYYIEKSRFKPPQQTRIEKRAVEVAASDSKSRLSGLPAGVIGNILKQLDPEHKGKDEEQLRGDNALEKGTLPFFPSEEKKGDYLDTTTISATRNPMNGGHRKSIKKKNIKKKSIKKKSIKKKSTKKRNIKRKM